MSTVVYYSDGNFQLLVKTNSYYLGVSPKALFTTGNEKVGTDTIVREIVELVIQKRLAMNNPIKKHECNFLYAEANNYVQHAKIHDVFSTSWKIRLEYVFFLKLLKS